MKNPNLPEEILIEIFSRLPTKFVGRCRSLSKSWRTNLSTPQFIKLHLTRKPNTPDFIFTSSKDTYLHVARIGNHALDSRRLDLPDNGYTVLGSCNGLILLKLLHLRVHLLVLNPLTLQHLTIQSTLLSICEDLAGVKYGFGYDSRFDDYKIVRITPSRGESPTFVDVYALKEGAWRRLSHYPYSHGCFFIYSNVVFVNGALHWLAISRVDQHVVIVAFDLVTESFREITAPSIYKLTWRDLFAVGGCLIVLGLAHDPTRRDVVCIMKECGQVNSWANFSLTDTVQVDCVVDLRPLCFFGGNELVFLNSKGSVIIGSLTEGTLRRYTNVAGSMKFIHSGCSFADSLVSPIQ